MILIHTNNSDVSTTQIIDWLYLKKAAYNTFNGQFNSSEITFSYELGKQKENFIIHKKESNHTTTDIDLQQVNVQWYRRVENSEMPKSLKEKPVNNYWKDISQFYKDEFKSIKEGFHNELADRNGLSNYFTNGNINKLYSLKQALKAGLIIPQTLASNNKEEIQQFYNRVGELIIKPLSQTRFYQKEDNTSFSTYTEIFTQNHINELPETFFPCLVQEQIQKEYEIRTFYLNGECYSMAIFSQENMQTAVDFRRYDKAKPNRTIPYQLPKEIEEKIKPFMQNVNLDTGSLDFIRAKDGRYIFLEVNPVGQFGMVSIPCNYNLEEKVADYLINLMG